MPLDKEHKCIYKINADKGIKCECSMCSEYPYTVSFCSEGRYEVIIKGKKAIARKVE